MAIEVVACVWIVEVGTLKQRLTVVRMNCLKHIEQANGECERG